MTRAALCIPVLLLAAAVWAAGPAAQPPPEFDSHTLPSVQTPSGRSAEWVWIDLAALGAFLAVATVLVLKVRSRAGVLATAVAAVAYFGFWRRGCICSVGAIQNVALALGDPSYALPLTALVFLLAPLLVALFFGRTFCAGVCPLGAVQELVLIRPVTVPAWLDRPLRLLPVVYLAVAGTLAALAGWFVICQYDPFVGFFRLGGPAAMLVLGAAVLAVGTFVGRPYCRYACPLGVLLGWASRFSQWHATITPDECIRCRLCEDACPYGAIRTPTEDRPPARRAAGRAVLGAALVLLPVLTALGGLLGYLASDALAQGHPDVRLARHVWHYDAVRAEAPEPPDREVEGFVRRARLENVEFEAARDGLYERVAHLQRRFRGGGLGMGLFVGVVAGASLVRVSLRRRRSDYTMDPQTCVSCLRCIDRCPRQQVWKQRRGGASEAAAPPVQKVPETVP